MTITIRNMTRLDVPPVLGLMRSLYAHEGMHFDSARGETALLGIIPASDRGFILIADYGSRTAGYSVATYGYSLEFGGQFVLLDEIYVDAPFRGSGVGKLLISAVLERCRREQIRAVRLEVERTNQRVRGLYESLGFQAHDRDLMTCFL